MKDRSQRCPLPARRDVGGAEIKDHGDAQAPRQSRAVAELNRELPLGPVQNRLAVQTDDIDVCRIDSVARQKLFHRFAVRGGDQFFRFADYARPRLAVG